MKKGFSLKDVSIRSKLLISHGILIVMAFIVVLVCVLGIYALTSHIQDLYSAFDISVEAAGGFDAVSFARNLIIFGVAMIVIGLSVAFGILYKVVVMIVTPVAQLAEVADMMSQGDLQAGEIITYEAEDELGQLAAAIRGTCDGLYDYVSEISLVLGEVAEGDLTRRADEITAFPGDFASIKTSLVHILKGLNSTLSDINLSAEQVNIGAEQISDGAQTLAQGATEQASSIEELSAAITEVSGHVSDTAHNATTAKQEMEETEGRVMACNEQMHHMTEAMKEIGHTSEEISKIVKTIEDIAFQTNILALNAAVEAARAGEAGKGFAVVADEVRSLASKSAEASKNTEELISGSVRAVEKGRKIAVETAEALNLVVEGTRSVSDAVMTIEEAARTQADSLSQINIGIEQISTVVQTSAATAEESAAGSEELSGQAALLKEAVNKFRLYA